MSAPARSTDPTAAERMRRHRDRRSRGRAVTPAEIDPDYHPAWLIQQGYLDPADYDGPDSDDALAKAIGDALDDLAGCG